MNLKIMRIHEVPTEPPFIQGLGDLLTPSYTRPDVQPDGHG